MSTGVLAGVAAAMAAARKPAPVADHPQYRTCPDCDVRWFGMPDTDCWCCGALGQTPGGVLRLTNPHIHQEPAR